MGDTKITFVGHISKDVVTKNNETSFKPGGGIYFGAVAACNMGAKCHAITKMAKDDVTLFNEMTERDDLDFVIFPSDVSTSFVNEYRGNNADDRVQWLKTKGSPFFESDFEDLKGEDNVVHITPLSFGEVPEALIPILRKKSKFLSADAQGFVRHVEPGDEKAIYTDWNNKKDYLPMLDMLKMDNKEGILLTGESDMMKACSKVSDWGVKMIVYTCQDNVSVFVGRTKQVFTGKFGDWNLEGRTGRGDTTAAAFLVHMFGKGTEFDENYQDLVDYMAMITTIKMNAPGAYRPL